MTPLSPFADWPPELRDELDRGMANSAVGTRLLLEGETRRLSFGPGEWMVHDLVNVGDAELNFTTVEYLRSANEALPLGDAREAA